jgi:hypothetical protein
VASYSGNLAVHETLTGGAADQVTLSGLSGDEGLTIVNRSGSDELYFTYSGPGSGPSVAVVGAADTYVVPACVGSLTIPGVSGKIIVSIISNSAVAYSVLALQ